MTTPDLCEKLEELAKWFEAYHLPDRYESSTTYLWHKEQAALIRSLIALVPKDGEVVVPEEPTARLQRVFEEASGYAYNTAFTAGYKAMLKAAKEET